MTIDPVIAALEQVAPLPAGIARLDAPSIAKLAYVRLSLETPERAERILDEIINGTATFSFLEMIGDFVLLVINSEMHGSHEFAQIHRSCIDDNGTLH